MTSFMNCPLCKKNSDNWHKDRKKTMSILVSKLRPIAQPGGNVKMGKFSGKRRKLCENRRISSDRNFSKSREFSRFHRLNILPWSGLGCFGYKLYGGLSEFMWWSKKMLSLGGPIKKNYYLMFYVSKMVSLTCIIQY